MGTLTYLYDPTQHVYVIVECIDPNNANRLVQTVRPGKIIRVRYEILVTETKLTYEIQVDKNPGTTSLEESDVFPDLASAVLEYETRIL